MLSLLIGCNCKCKKTLGDSLKIGRPGLLSCYPRYQSINTDCFRSGTSKLPDQNSSFIWRFPIAFQIIPLIILFCVIWFMPESPRWLVRMGREDEARFILQRLRGSEGEEGEAAEAELQDIINIRDMENETAHQQSYFHMFFGIGSGKLHTGRRVQLVIWLQILQEWVGIAGITIYGPTIFTIAGIGAEDRLWVSGLNNITYMVSLIPATWTQL